MNVPTPLLDFFKRGEVARDVRLLAAEGALAPRAHEQLAILVLLLEDRDRRFATTADETLDPDSRGVAEGVPGALRRADRPAGVLRRPRHLSGRDARDRVREPRRWPLIDTDPVAEDADDEDAEDERQSGVQQLAKMSFPSGSRRRSRARARCAPS